jgi:hypothetical protein
MERNIWLDTVRRIREFGVVRATLDDGSVEDRDVDRRALPARWDGASLPTVRVIEAPTPMTLTVSWCDPCTGHYGYQTWRLGVARRAGICVLSGRPIGVGDAIYAPHAIRRRVANAGAMILASAGAACRQSSSLAARSDAG